MCGRDLLALENATWQMKVPMEKIDMEAPESLRQMLELQFEGLGLEEQRVLEVASVTGVTFTANANAVGTTVDQERLKTLAKTRYSVTHGVPHWIASVPGRDHFPVLRICAGTEPGGLVSRSSTGTTGEGAAATPRARWKSSLGMKTK
jgi:hypothetical protein